MGSPHIRQEVHNTAAGTQRIVVSNNNDSNHFNVIETTSKNGNYTVQSDLVTKNMVRTDNVNYIHGNQMNEVNSNSSTYVNGRYEISTSSSYRIIGGSNLIHGRLHSIANNDKIEVVGARTDFGDDRVEPLADPPQSEPQTLRPEAAAKISKTNNSVIDTPTMGSKMPGVNLLQQTVYDVGNTIADYSKKIGLINSDSASERANAEQAARAEKDERQLKKIQAMPDCATKIRILEQYNQTGDPRVLYEHPATDQREIKKTFDNNEYQRKVANYTLEVMPTEARM